MEGQLLTFKLNRLFDGAIEKNAESKAEVDDSRETRHADEIQ